MKRGGFIALVAAIPFIGAIFKAHEHNDFTFFSHNWSNEGMKVYGTCRCGEKVLVSTVDAGAFDVSSLDGYNALRRAYNA